MKSTNFFPSTIPQVLLLLLLSFSWIFLVVQFDLKYMNHFSLDKRMSIESLLMYSGPIILYFIINYIKKKDSRIPIKNFNISILLKSSISALILVLFTYTINFLIHNEHTFSNPYQDNYWMLVSIGLIGPIGEELIFRGIIQRGLYQTLKPIWSILLSAILFMFVHQPNQYLLAIITGLLFGYVYYKNNNILSPIILHIITNNFSTLIAYILYLNFQ